MVALVGEVSSLRAEVSALTNSLTGFVASVAAAQSSSSSSSSSAGDGAKPAAGSKKRSITEASSDPPDDDGTDTFSDESESDSESEGDDAAARGGGPPPRRTKRMWTEPETEALVHGIRSEGIGNWSAIIAWDRGAFALLQARSPGSLKDKYRTMRREGSID